MVCTHSYMVFRHREKDYQTTPPEELGNKEDTKRRMHGPQKKWRITRISEQIGSMGGEKTEMDRGNRENRRMKTGVG